MLAFIAGCILVFSILLMVAGVDQEQKFPHDDAGLMLFGSGMLGTLVSAATLGVLSI